MSKMIAYCGLVCSECPTLMATKNDDIQAKRKVADYLSKTYGLNYKPEDINCDGCLSENGNLLAYCRTCAIRKCAREKGHANCAQCPDQPCNALIQFHKFSPDAKQSFDRVVRSFSEND